MDTVQSLLFVAGAIYALGRERRRALAFPLIWTGVMILPSVLSDAAPLFGRMLGATPAIAILVALGCAQLARLGSEIQNPKSGIGRAARLGLVAAIVAPAYSAVRMGRDYFATWARDPGLYTAFDVGLRESAEYLALLPHDELISLSPVDRDLPIFRFTFRDDVSRLKTFNGRRCAVYPSQPERDWTHIDIVAEETHSLSAIQRAFPSGQIAKKFFDVGAPYAVAFRVKAGSRTQAPLQEMAVFDHIALVGLQISDRAVRPERRCPSPSRGRAGSGSTWIIRPLFTLRPRSTCRLWRKRTHSRATSGLSENWTRATVLGSPHAPGGGAWSVSPTNC